MLSNQIKKHKYIFVLLFLQITTLTVIGQSIAINADGSTANASAILDIKTTTKGLLIPRLSKAEKNAIASPANGLLIFQSSPDSVGFYFYNNTQWVYISNSNADTLSWKRTGNVINNTQFIGTLNDSAVRFRVNNFPSGVIDSISLSTSIGYKSLPTQNAGQLGNTAFGYKTLLVNTSGFYNTAVGLNVLRENISGIQNTAIGDQAMRFNTTGFGNIAVGSNALYSNKNSFYNVAIGRNAMFADTTGQSSVAIGDNALASTQNSNYNVAIGAYALNTDSSGTQNVAVGTSALRLNKIGVRNVAVGDAAMYSNSNSSNNVAIGTYALFNYTGNTNAFTYNCAVGNGALFSTTNGTHNTAIGADAMLLTTAAGNYNVALGFQTLANNRANENVGLGTQALFNHKSGNFNVAVGTNASYFDTSGTANTVVGSNAFLSNRNGVFNSAFGYETMGNNNAGYSNNAFGARGLLSNIDGHDNAASGNAALNGNTYGNFNTGMGNLALRFNQTGSNNTALGYDAGANNGQNPSNFTAIGNNAGKVGGNSNTIEIGNTSVFYIGGQVGWSSFSDERIKENINYNNVPGLAFIKKLQPATYYFNIHTQNKLLGIADTLNWEGKYDIEKIQQTGFIAQQVAQAAKEINYNFSGVQAPINGKGLYSLQYSSFVVPMIKAIKEEDERIEKLEKEIETLKQQLNILLKKQK
jgi:hypothetical protein